jgi:Fanconi anemia group I protein
LQDFLLIVLRKSLFSRELEARLVTLECLIFVAETMNAVCGPSGSSENGVNDPLALEILSQLRRCMTQQAQIREKLYDGLMELVKKKPYLVDHVVGVLLPQLQKFLVQDEEDNVSNLNMHDCVEEMSGNVKEPIGNLLRSIVYCLSIFNQNTEFQNEPEIFSNVLCAKKILESLATWLSSSELDDFGVDKSSDFESLQTLQLAKLLGGVYEVFLEYIVIITTFSSSIWAKRFLTLSERKQLLGDLIKEHGKAPKGKL